MLASADAIILRRVAYSESSFIITIFTREFGKIALIAKGARKPKSPFSSVLEPMNIVHIDFLHKDARHVQILKNVHLIEDLVGIRNHFENLQFGLTTVDILDKTTHENDPSTVHYRLCKSTLQILNKRDKGGPLIFAFFLLQLSIRSGFMPQLNCCCNCSQPLSDAVIDIHSGEFSCLSCIPLGEIKISKATLNVLKLLTTTHINELDSIDFEIDKFEELNTFLDWYTEFHIVGMKKVKSLKILRELTRG